MEKREFPEWGVAPPALQVLKLAAVQAVPLETHGNPRWRPYQQQIPLCLLPLHGMALPPPHPKETWLSSEDTSSPSGCSEQGLFFLTASFFFLGGG